MSELRVTILGTGTMGTPMARNLAAAGLTTTVWDRSAAHTKELEAAGAAAASTPTEAVGGADVVITMLPDADAVLSVMDHQGALDALPAGGVWVQMGTIGLAATDRMAALTDERRPDVFFVDAPVSGSKGPAEAGKLTILASGPVAARGRLEPVFSALGQRTVWRGDAGHGMRTKIVLNTWLALLMEALAETLKVADDLEVTHDELLDVLDGNALAAPWAISKVHKIDSGSYEAEFPLQWALKDVDLSISSVLDHLPALAATSDQWHRAVAEGYGQLDISATYMALRGAAPAR